MGLSHRPQEPDGFCGLSSSGGWSEFQGNSQESLGLAGLESKFLSRRERDQRSLNDLPFYRFLSHPQASAPALWRQVASAPLFPGLGDGRSIFSLTVLELINYGFLVLNRSRSPGVHTHEDPSQPPTLAHVCRPPWVN